MEDITLNTVDRPLKTPFELEDFNTVAVRFCNIAQLQHDTTLRRDISH